MILELLDGGIIDIKSDNENFSGCETCDFGSKYVNWFELELTTNVIYIEASQMYEYPLAEGHMMKIILNNVDEIREMTEKEFAEWIETELRKEEIVVDVKVEDK